MEGMNTTLYFWRRKKNQEVLMCFLGEKYGEKRERKNAQKTPKQLLNPTPPNFLILVRYRVPWAIYSPWHALQGMAHLQGMWVGLAAQQGAPR